MRRAKHEQIARVERGQLAHFLASYRRSKAKAKAKVLPEPQRPIAGILFGSLDPPVRQWNNL